MRLAAQWPYLIEDDTRKAALLAEYIVQFDGYDPGTVQDAATAAIGKAVRGAPSAAEIKFELRTLLSASGQTRTERPAWREDDADYYRSRTPEEVARRAAQCLAWRKQYGLDKPTCDQPSEPQPIEDDVEDFRRKHAAVQIRED